MKIPKRILVFQTAFLGDVILTLPMIQVLHKRFPLASIDVVTTPIAAELLANHPAISTIIRYDKRKSQKGIIGILSLSRQLRMQQYDLAVVPHRSFRTAVAIALSGINERIGFSNASGTLFYNHIVRYEKSKHEIDRNLSLIDPLNIAVEQKELPSLYPTVSDIVAIDKLLFEKEILNQLARGMQYKAIASHFSLSVETVRTHIRNIYEKLQVHNKAEAIQRAYRN